jgi:hypothetical protein
MEAIRQFMKPTNGSITIDLPEQYADTDLEVIILPMTESAISLKKENKYDFSELVGKLQWQGDALTEQKKLRDEWQ